MIDVIKEAFSVAANIVADNNEVRVTTHCLYPSNEFVRVRINGAVNSFVISDNGGWFKYAALQGRDVSLSEKIVSQLVQSKGLRLSQSAIVTDVVPLEGLVPSVAIVAEVSREMAEWCFHKFKFKRIRNFKALLDDLMERTFYNDIIKNYNVVGNSTKTHKFNYAIRAGERTILVDSVSPDAVSINSRVVANLDVRQNHNPHFEQVVIYDDEENWTHENLSLLSMAASLVPFSSAENVVASWK